MKDNKLTIYDIFIILIILFQGANHLIYFSSPFYKYIIIAFFGILFIKYLKNGKVKKTNSNIIFMLIIILLYAQSIIISFDNRLFVPMIFFIIEIFTFKMYIGLFDSKKQLFERLLKIILISSTFLSIVGFIQIIGFKLNIRPLYDFKWIGIIPNYYGYLTEGRFYSIYDEPAHLCTILGAGLFASYYYMKNFNKKYIFELIMIALFGLFTGSVVTYSSMLIFFGYILFYSKCNDNKIKKTYNRILFVFILLIFVAAYVSSDLSLFSPVINKISNFLSNNSNSVYLQNETTFALKSNYLIAIRKIKNGYIFGTGLFTHEFYYYSYIDVIYRSHYQKYLNYSDAASIFIRVLSEFGILSIFIYLAILIYIFKIYKRKDYINMFYILLFISQGMRLGDYTWLFNCLPIIIIFSSIKKENLIKNERKLV